MLKLGRVQPMVSLIILNAKLLLQMNSNIINYKFSRITTIQSKFPRTAYFNHSRIINRVKIDFNDQTTPTISTILYNFFNGVNGWKGSNLLGGPWPTNEFIFKSTDSLKAAVQLTAAGQYILYTQPHRALLIMDE